MGDRIHLDTEEIVSLYEDEKMPAIKIANMFGVSDETILNRLKRADANIRSTNRKSEVEKKYAEKTYKNKEWLIEQYVVSERTGSDIAAECGVDKATVFAHIDKNNIGRTKVVRDRISLDTKKIVSLYEDKGLSAKKIGDILGVSDETILNRLRRAGANIRSKKKMSREDKKMANKTYKNKEWLRHQYADMKKTGRQIASECKTGHNVIFRYIDKYGIERHEGREPEDLSGQTFDRLTVLSLNEERGKFGQVMFLCKCVCGNETNVASGLLKSGGTRSCGCLIADMASARCGPKSPVWNPDLTDEEREDKRDYKEYKEWRKAVYERDNHTCQKCGATSVTLNAHHIESYAKNKDLRTTLENGVTLCADRCHANFHHIYGYDNNREQFNEFMLTEDTDA